MIEQLARVPVEVDYASEFRYRDPVMSERTLLLVISQSGETADTIAALREAKERGSKVLAICNVQGSMVTRESDGTILTHAGPEIGVASTKAFTSQMIALYLFAMYLGQLRGALSAEESARHAQELAELPVKIERLLSESDDLEELAREFHRATDFLYLGSGINFPVALEGALKLKEISYIHAEGYPTGELKHGPTALVNENLPIVVLATRDRRDADSMLRYEKSVSNIREFVEMEIPVLAIVTEGDKELTRIAPGTISVPDVPVLLQPLVEVIPLQFLAYHIAVLCGRNVDRPRHLSKSVMAE